MMMTMDGWVDGQAGGMDGQADGMGGCGRLGGDDDGWKAGVMDGWTG